MNHFTTLLIRNLLNNEHNLPEFESVLSEVFRQQLEEAVNDVLNYELEQFLGYERYRHTDKTDSRNGFKPDRTIDTKYGPITIKMPRDRLGLFASSLIPAYVRRTEGTERSVIDLFDLGLTNSEITEAVDRMFGAKVSKGTVSNITNRIISNIDSFKNRTLASEYAVIYIDATMMPLRRDTLQKWTTDVSQFNFSWGKCYLSTILDMNTNEIISYDLSKSPNLEQIDRMLNRAFDKFPSVEGLIFHSDQGWQYQHAYYRTALKEHGIIQSMSRKGNCYDNCIMETFFGRLKNEMYYGYEKDYASFEDFSKAVEEYIDYYNNKRIQAKTKWMPPVQYRIASMRSA